MYVCMYVCIYMFNTVLMRINFKPAFYQSQTPLKEPSAVDGWGAGSVLLGITSPAVQAWKGVSATHRWVAFQKMGLLVLGSLM